MFNLTIDYDFGEEFGIAFGPDQVREGEIIAYGVQLRDGGLFRVYVHRMHSDRYTMTDELIGAVWSASAAVALVAKSLAGGR